MCSTTVCLFHGENCFFLKYYTALEIKTDAIAVTCMVVAELRMLNYVIPF